MQTFFDTHLIGTGPSTLNFTIARRVDFYRALPVSSLSLFLSISSLAALSPLSFSFSIAYLFLVADWYTFSVWSQTRNILFLIDLIGVVHPIQLNGTVNPADDYPIVQTSASGAPKY